MITVQFIPMDWIVRAADFPGLVVVSYPICINRRGDAATRGLFDILRK